MQSATVEARNPSAHLPAARIAERRVTNGLAIRSPWACDGFRAGERRLLPLRIKDSCLNPGELQLEHVAEAPVTTNSELSLISAPFVWLKQARLVKRQREIGLSQCRPEFIQDSPYCRDNQTGESQPVARVKDLPFQGTTPFRESKWPYRRYRETGHPVRTMAGACDYQAFRRFLNPWR